MRSEKESCRYRYLGSLFFRRSTLSDRTNIDDWAEMVVRYSARQLTYATDKFPAISALAQLVSEAIKDEYIVGYGVANFTVCCYGRASQNVLGIASTQV